MFEAMWLDHAIARPGAESDITIRTILAPELPSITSLKVGAQVLAAFGMLDDWRPTRYNSSFFTIRGVKLVSSAGILVMPSGTVVENTLDHTDPERHGYLLSDGKAVVSPDGYERRIGGRIEFYAEPAHHPGRYLSLLLGCPTNHFHVLTMNIARLGLLNADDLRLDSILIPLVCQNPIPI